MGLDSPDVDTWVIKSAATNYFNGLDVSQSFEEITNKTSEE